MSPEAAKANVKRKRRGRAALSLFSNGEPMQWLTGGALAICLAMVIGLLVLIVAKGVITFWPVELVSLQTIDGRRYLGELSKAESFSLTKDLYLVRPEKVRQVVGGPFPSRAGDAEDQAYRDSIPDDAQLEVSRRLLRTGNFEITNRHFRWVDDFAVQKEERPRWGLVVERLKNGRFYGEPVAFLDVRDWNPERSVTGDTSGDVEVLVARREGHAQERMKLSAVNLDEDEIVGEVIRAWEGAELAWVKFQELHGAVVARYEERRYLEKVELGKLSARKEGARQNAVEARVLHGHGSSEHNAALEEQRRILEEIEPAIARVEQQIGVLEKENSRYGLFLRTAQGDTKNIRIADITRAYAPNQLGFWERISVYLSRWWEFLSEDPREANSEGGVLPAIFGTVVMTLIMCLAVVPFGVLAALYLREYAKAGPVVSAVRIAVNNLAGVPSIVFGVFGLGFFCYGLGKYIDGGPERGLGITPWSRGVWLLALGGLIVMGVGAVLLGIWTTTTKSRSASLLQRIMRRGAVLLWLASATLAVLLVIYTPFFQGMFLANLDEGKPTYGTSGLLWASLTLALLTLPVVIVATEEALAAVPNSMREGSYGCGASKWQTIRRIVLPRAMPGIMTGSILAMARGAGEVAPLMLVGVMKMAQKLAVDGVPPFIHPERSFMHLGFHIYDVGFQSPNSEAAKPMVFTTTLLLISIIAFLNIAAIWLRGRLRKKFIVGQF